MKETDPPRSDGAGSRGEVGPRIYRLIAEYTYDWESWHAPDGKLLWVNAAVARMTGYGPDECMAMEDYPLPLIAEVDRKRLADVLRDAVNGGSGNDLEFRLDHRDGSERWMAISWQSMYDHSHSPLGFRASVRDITERHQLREELRIHNKHLEQLVQERTVRIAQLEQQRLKMEKLAALGQLAAGVAHEVNNPLAGIRNAFALFKSNLPPDDEHFELLELIDSEIVRIRSITHQMYQLYRPSQQQPSKISIEQTVAEVLALLKPVAKKAQVRFEVQQEACVAVVGLGETGLGRTEAILREGEVKQVLFNLARNAVQASPANEAVTISFATTDHSVRCNVADHGLGIEESIMPHIFDPFFSTKSNAPGQGMGLGLSVSRSLVEAMGGTISVDSKVGEGSTFRLTLPRDVTAPRAPVPPVPGTAGSYQQP